MQDMNALLFDLWSKRACKYKQSHVFALSTLMATYEK